MPDGQPRGGKHLFAVGTSAVIRDDAGRVLFHHQPFRDFWTLPGGGAERDEPPWQAVIREVREETELDAAVDRLTSVSWRPAINEVLFTFACSVTGGVLTPTREADEFAWWQPDEIPGFVHARYVARVRAAAAGQKDVVFLVED